MARSPQYWFDVMVAEKDSMSVLGSLTPVNYTAQTFLSDVTTTSRVKRWGIWLWAVAVGYFVLDALLQVFKIDLEAISMRSRCGTLPWYVYKALAFQYGDSLVYLNNEFNYAAINSVNQIVKRAAAQEAVNTVNIKVAKLSGSTPAKLSAPEKAAFDAYMETIKPAGIFLNIISDDPDMLILGLNVYYDPLILTSTGESILTPGTFPVEDAINAYISNLPFNGMLELCRVQDAIQAAAGNGVVNAYITSAQAKYGTNPYLSFSERYLPNSGYLVIDSASPLNTTINYIANV